MRNAALLLAALLLASCATRRVAGRKHDRWGRGEAVPERV